LSSPVKGELAGCQVRGGKNSTFPMDCSRCQTFRKGKERGHDERDGEGIRTKKLHNSHETEKCGGEKEVQRKGKNMRENRDDSGRGGKARVTSSSQIWTSLEKRGGKGTEGKRRIRKAGSNLRRKKDAYFHCFIRAEEEPLSGNSLVAKG